MKKLLFISLLFGIILNSYTQTVINLSPDSTLYDLHLLPPSAAVPLDSLDLFVVNAHDRDTAIVTTAIGFPTNADYYKLNYLQGLTAPLINTGTVALLSSDSTAFQGLKIPIDVPVDSSIFSFALYSVNGTDTVSNSDTTMLDSISTILAYQAALGYGITGSAHYISDITRSNDTLYITVAGSVTDKDTLRYIVVGDSSLAYTGYPLTSALDTMTTAPNGLAIGGTTITADMTNPDDSLDLNVGGWKMVIPPVPSPAAIDLLDSLKFSYSFDETGVGVDTGVFDNTASNHDGRMQGFAYDSTGIIDACYYNPSDANASHWTQPVTDTGVFIPYHADFDFSDSGTVAGWFKHDIPIFVSGIAFGTHNGGSGFEGWAVKKGFNGGDGSPQLQVYVGSNAALQTVVCNTSPTANTWYHIVLTLNGDTGKVYVDGVLDTAFIQTYNPFPGQDFNVFRNPGNGFGADFFKGWVDEVHGWKNRVLNATEVDQLYDLEVAGTSYPWGMAFNPITFIIMVGFFLGQYRRKILGLFLLFPVLAFSQIDTDSLSIGGGIYVNGILVRNDSLIFQQYDGDEWGLPLESVVYSGGGGLGANVYWVARDGEGNDANDGSDSTTNAWATLAYAVTQVNSGDTIAFTGGTHTINTQVSVPIGISLLGGQGADTSLFPRITTSSLSTEWTAVLSLSSDPTISGNQSISYLAFDGNSRTGAQAINIVGRHDVRIHNCDFYDWEYIAVGIKSTDGSESVPPTTYLTGFKFDSNYTSNCAGSGGGWYRAALFMGGLVDVSIYNNFMEEIGRAVGTQGWPIKAWYWGGWISGRIAQNTLIKTDASVWDFAIEIENNNGLEIDSNIIVGAIDLNNNRDNNGETWGSTYIHGNTINNPVPATYGFGGVILEFVVQGGLIEQNIFNYCSPGVKFTPRGDSIDLDIQYNVFRNNSNAGGLYGGLRFLGNNGWKINNLKVLNNTFHGNTSSNPLHGIIADSEGGTYTGDSIWIQNNIFVNYSQAPVTLTSAGSITYYAYENNMVYNCGNSNLPDLTGTPGTVVSANNDPGTDPLFTNAPTILRVQTISDAIDAGKYIGLSFDVEGVAVGNPPNMGAYETTEDP